MTQGLPTALVLDASILVAAVLDEPRQETVLKRVRESAGKVPLLVPPMARHEVENALLKANRHARVRAGPEDLARLAHRALVLVTEVADRPDPLPLAMKHGLTAYDAAYLAITLDSGPGARLWTFDERLADAARAEGVLAGDADFPA